MPHLIIVLIVLGLVFWGSKFLKGVAPAAQARLLRKGGGMAALVAAGFLLLRGQMEVALGLGGLAFYLLGFSGTPHWSGLFKSGGVAGAPAGGLRSAMVELAPDLVSGEVLAGSFEGARLGDLSREQCEALYQSCLREDAQGARLLEIYLGRRFPGWRGAGERDDDARRRGGAGKMTEDEAYEVLGLAKGASGEDIARAHRALMKKLHPDQGGTTSLAARVNEARDILSRRH